MKETTNRKGMVLPIVVIVMGMMLMLGFSTLSLISNQSKFNIINEDTNKALAYAEAGYNKYLWHLNDDLNFYSTKDHQALMNKWIEFEDGYFMLEVNKPSDSDRFITIKSTGRSKNSPHIQRTVLAKIRKKQFVHHVYVSDDDGDNIWWTSGDESHGPYHTNKDLRIKDSPIFFDTVSYVGAFKKGKDERPPQAYQPDFKVKSPTQPQKEMTPLEFPKSNQELESWAAKDGMVFEGRTCIYLDGDQVKIRNQNDDKVETYSIAKQIPHLVIYVAKVANTDSTVKGGTDKFGIRSGNVFVSGELEGRLTIAAEERIYITYDDPTNWYDYHGEDIYKRNAKLTQPPTTFPWGKSYPQSGGITYKKTTFSGHKNGDDSTLSSYDSKKKIWTRYATGKDMLGLIANNDILILHYGWPKKAHYSDGQDDHWSGTRWEWRWYRGWWNPEYRWELTGPKYDVAPENITIHAALFSLTGGFGYEGSYDGPAKGAITLWGNITQKERKAVASSGRNGVNYGYRKRYAHDPRMFYDYPPRILEPANLGWEIHEWKEIKEHVEAVE